MCFIQLGYAQCGPTKQSLTPCVSALSNAALLQSSALAQRECLAPHSRQTHLLPSEAVYTDLRRTVFAFCLDISDKSVYISPSPGCRSFLLSSIHIPSLNKYTSVPLSARLRQATRFFDDSFYSLSLTCFTNCSNPSVPV